VTYIPACRMLMEHIHSPFVSEHIPIIDHGFDSIR
jgi:hypothetical protein